MMMNENRKVIAVAGPTASGKTKLAIEIAGKFNGEIISCDSMQVYKGMDIGTAKPTAEELLKVKHHMIGVVEPSAAFSAADYVDMAEGIISGLTQNGKLPVVAGGTGLYARSLLYKVDFDQDSRDDALRAKLTETAENGGIEELYSKLMELDGDLEIHINNQKRVIRALEYCLVTGRPFSRQSEESSAVPRYDFLMLCISYRDRSKLYDRINARVDAMVSQGLVEEAKEYYNNRVYGTTSVQAIGYKELFPYFDGNSSLEEALENIKRETRRYAKRQLTWFRKEQRIHWLYADDYKNESEFLNEALRIVEKHLESAPVNL